MRIRMSVIFSGVLILFISYACNTQEVRLNDLQVIGSHNSYKIQIEEPLWKYIHQQNAQEALALQYGHIPIREQLELGLRSLELDVFHDPRGGYYSNPQGLTLLKEMGLPVLEFDQVGNLNEPGLKVFHVQDIDFRSHHLLFKDCLKAMKQWSDKNPDHTPIFVTMNTKDIVIDSFREPMPFTKPALDSIDLEIRSVFPEDKLITPDLVRGEFQTLEQAVLAGGWPKLQDVKGRFLFVLDENRDKISLYLQGHPSLKKRVLFTNSKEGNPEAAFRIVNNPINDFNYIRELVNKGYLVRTRADADTRESREEDYTRFEKAKASGAQVISTDYYVPSKLYQSSYKVIFENGSYQKVKKVR